MNIPLQEALARQGKLAFRRVRSGAELIKRFHRLPASFRSDADLQRVHGWLVVPFSLWPIDVIGLADHLIQLAEKGKPPTPDLRALITLLGEPPRLETCDAIGTHEHLVKNGSYESLTKAQHKFDIREKRLLKNQEFLNDWDRVKRRFDLVNHPGRNGVIRRRMVFERNFRPPDWNFSWRSKRAQFENVFDAFCHKWALYGMEGDKPLLQKLSVNITPYGTMIVIPRYWSFDYIRDLKWRSVTQLHQSRDVDRQGAKLDANESERRALAAKAREFMAEAKRIGMKGSERDFWVLAKLGIAESDPRQLRRLLKIK